MAEFFRLATSGESEPWLMLNTKRFEVGFEVTITTISMED
jgi:hypothetical protein